MIPTAEELFEAAAHTIFASTNKELAQLFPKVVQINILQYYKSIDIDNCGKVLEKGIFGALKAGSSIERAFYLVQMDDVIEKGLELKGEKYTEDIATAISNANMQAQELKNNFDLNTTEFNLGQFLSNPKNCPELYAKLCVAGGYDFERIINTTIGGAGIAYEEDISEELALDPEMQELARAVHSSLQEHNQLQPKKSDGIKL